MKMDDPTIPVTSVASIPEWLAVDEPAQVEQLEQLAPSKVSAQLRTLTRELREIEYGQIFERAVEEIYRGNSLQSVLEGDHRIVSYEDFLRWIKRDPVRHERYKEAQELRTEFMTSEIIRIADGADSDLGDSSEAVQRAKLQIDTRKWLMSAWNKKRYGEVKQVELGGTISILGALEQANQRLVERTVLDEVEDAVMSQPKTLEMESDE